MEIAQLTLSFDGINVSAQVGDMVYYSYDTNNIGGFDHSELTTTKKLGEIVEIHINATNNVFNITVEYDSLIVGVPPTDAFISFAKEKKVNTSSLLGHYADIKFINNSTEKAELFSIGSEVVESSK